MPVQEQYRGPTETPSGDAKPIKAAVMRLSSPWVYLGEDGPRHLNEGLEPLAHRLLRDHGNASRRSNCGGWHYAFDLFKFDEAVVAELREEMEQHVQAFLNHFRPP